MGVWGSNCALTHSQDILYEETATFTAAGYGDWQNNKYFQSYYKVPLSSSIVCSRVVRLCLDLLLGGSDWRTTAYTAA